MKLADSMNGVREEFQAEIYVDKTFKARQIAIDVL
jgi:hypothetical protein